VAERIARRTGAHRNRDIVRFQVPHQSFSARHAQCLGEALAHQRLAYFQELRRCDRQIQRLHHIVSQVLGTAPEDCLVFEDSPFGVTAAKAAHMTAIAVPDEAMADSKYHHADQIIRKLADFDLAAYGLPPRP
jgi:phosphoglycolate phosphatase-like HAD superfamily hydrolase